MNDFLQMDIFFFITSATVLILGACAAYITWRISRILTHIEYLSEQAADESDAIRADLAEMRADIRKGKGRLKSLFSFFGSRVRRATAKKR